MRRRTGISAVAIAIKTHRSEAKMDERMTYVSGSDSIVHNVHVDFDG